MPYKCGTLSYGKAGLVTLFAWLLWGDFCFSLMEVVVPALVPLHLKSLQASSLLISVVMTTLPAFLNMTVCPWVSFKSDRFRSRWGRRIPFILTTLPFLCLSLVLIGWHGEAADFFHRNIGLFRDVAPATVAIGLIAVFVVAFQFFNMFVASLIQCLFVDVVPVEFLGRFNGLTRIVGTGAGMAFNIFLFRFAESHSKEILTGATLIYLVGFGMMCFFIKEGKYPPAPVTEEKATGLWSGVRIFFQESFSHRFYWFFFLKETFVAVAGAIAVFQIFFQKDMGLSLEQIGLMAGIGGGAALAAMYFASIFVDRWHPLRIQAYLGVFTAVTGFTSLIWSTMTIPASMFFWLSVGGTLSLSFGNAMGAVGSLTSFMRVMPKTRFGQFCSASAILRSVGTMLAGVLAGMFMDGVRWLCHGSDYAYRFHFVWSWLFSIVAGFFLYKAYREWLRLGGDKDYAAPAPWSPEGYEKLDEGDTSHVAKPHLVTVSLNIFSAGFILTLLLCPVFLFMMHRHGMAETFRWYLLLFVPLLSAVFWLWLMQVRSIKKDIAALAAGQSPRYGVPHHGVLMVMGVQGLLGFPIYWLQMFWTIRNDMARELLLFAGLQLMSSAALLIVMQILRLMERGFATEGGSTAHNEERVPVISAP
jgi:maltose/moltooligosaccharide transporter